MMKLIRLAAVCTLLLLAAAPSFAIGCNSCIGAEYPYCESTPGSKTRCEIGPDYCFTKSAPFCTNFAPESTPATAMLAEWTVASVTVSRPSQGTAVVTSHDTSAVAELSTADAPQK
jgi:hypothetical protein